MQAHNFGCSSTNMNMNDTNTTKYQVLLILNMSTSFFLSFRWMVQLGLVLVYFISSFHHLSRRPFLLYQMPTPLTPCTYNLSQNKHPTRNGQLFNWMLPISETQSTRDTALRVPPILPLVASHVHLARRLRSGGDRVAMLELRHLHRPS